MASQDLWRKISKLAEGKQLNMTELAKLSGVSRTNLYNIRDGKSRNPSFFMIEKIATVLGVSLDEFREKK